MNRIVRSIAVTALAMTYTACGSHTDAVTAPSSLQLTAGDTLAAVVQSAGAAFVADLDAMNSAGASLGFDTAPGAGGLGGSTAIASDFAGNGCVLNPATGRFDCAPVVKNGVTVTRSIALYDASGVMMDHFDSTTASSNVQSTEIGVRPTDTGADTVNRSRNMTATGLAGSHNPTRTWNGLGGGTSGAYWTDDVATRTADTQGAAIFTNIVITVPRSANPYPASGTISRQVTGTGQVIRNGKTKSLTINRTVLITFNGTEFVPMTVGDKNYILDLATGEKQ